jgi:hypothetical protein
MVVPVPPLLQLYVHELQPAELALKVMLTGAHTDVPGVTVIIGTTGVLLPAVTENGKPVALLFSDDSITKLFPSAAKNK